MWDYFKAVHHLSALENIGLQKMNRQGTACTCKSVIIIPSRIKISFSAACITKQRFFIFEGGFYQSSCF